MRVAVIDPGIRTFATILRSDGCSFSFADHNSGSLQQLVVSQSKIQSKLSAAKDPKEQRKYKNQICRVRKKIRHAIDELHNVTVKWLLENADLILLPKFNTAQMVKKRRNKFGHMSSMLDFIHI